MGTAGIPAKLLIKPGYRVVVLNAPEGVGALLGPLPEGATLATEPDGTHEMVLAFAQDQTELGRLAPTALSALAPGGLLWVAYPKGTSRMQTDLTRDRGWDVLKAAGYEGVALVSLTETWSALRLRPSADVRRR